jgi:DNA-binding winged helix-turn-helix (wHTH) protein/TolB-like protein/Tfp pilus assembly protein PilF
MTSRTKQIYEFGAFRLDATERLLYRHDQPLALPPKVFDTLLLLVTNSGHVLGKDEMMKRLWPDTFVEEGTLAQYISLLRKALGESAAWIENHPRRGYRFTAPVCEFHHETPELQIEEHTRTRTVIQEEVVTDQGRIGRLSVLLGALAVLAAVGAASLIWRSSRVTVRAPAAVGSVAVVPFRTVSDSGNDYLADGITEALITRLTNLKGLRVVSWSRVRRFRGSSLDAAGIGRELGVDVVIEGSVRIVSGRMRMSVHAVDAKSGDTVWALDRVEASSTNLLDVEAEVAQAAALRFKGSISTHERSLVTKSATKSAEAYDLVLRVRDLMKDGGSAVSLEKAEPMLTRAIQLDPDFAEAFGWLAFVRQRAYQTGLRGRDTLRAAISNATQALSRDPDALIAMRALAHIQHSTGRELEGLLMARRALESKPDDLDAIAGAAEAYFRTGLHDRAIPLFEKAIAGEPDNAAFREQLARIHLYARDYEKGSQAIAGLLPHQVGWFGAILYAESGHGKATEIRAMVRPSGGYFNGLALALVGDQRGATELWTNGVRYREALAARNDSPYNHSALAWMYAALGKREQALYHMRESLSPEPHHPILLFFAAETHGILGERQPSLRSLRTAIENGFFNLPMIDFASRPKRPLAILREDPEFHVLRADLARRVDELRTRY